ncbi:hypothetical protein PDIG_47070 [Penicillium digitatum PHI26]|uniref:Uncharacterized protein n=2 Tax=Penicillium digitatum TaxID=36651 RepID=K9FUA0_PEND2|nr:hypothetical protein PDIP_19000 [Penicillium digitatum Pd1]EKV12092.1 hypothetical protein PDIG_47070 [Penicillium digitatum PHI26]EKV20239.1 hypothetical protein PDIP_19000 [Penicillium digitatum Pd1]
MTYILFYFLLFTVIIGGTGRSKLLPNPKEAKQPFIIYLVLIALKRYTSLGHDGCH